MFFSIILDSYTQKISTTRPYYFEHHYITPSTMASLRVIHSNGQSLPAGNH